MKIGMITQWYEPEPGSAAHPTAIAESLQRAGHDVKVLTGFPNYPDGRVHSGYRQSLRFSEWRNGVRVTRVPLAASHDNSAVRRAATLSSFAVSATLQASVLAEAEACLVYLSPATVALPALLLRRLRRIPFAVYVQDLWPDSVMESGFIGDPHKAAQVEGLIHRGMSRVYRDASGIAVIAPGMKDILVSRGVPADKIVVIPNWINESVFRPTDPDPEFAAQLDPAAFWVMYAGGIGDLQGLDTAVRAISQLSDRPDIKLALVGEGVAVPGLTALVGELGVTGRVHFFGGHALASMPSIMSAGGVQLISLRDLPLFYATVPSKLQAAMACGLPVITCAPGDAAELTRRSGAGVASAAGDVGALADAFRHMADLSPTARSEMGEAGRAFYAGTMSEQYGTSAMVELLSREVR